jgi:hypothetical protein
MFGSQLLDVAIGMIFVYLLLSLICSAVNELLETYLKKRSIDLENGIVGLLGKDTGLVDRLYDHGLIFSLFRGTYAEAKSAKTLPSYIPSKDFATALTSVLGTVSGAAPTIVSLRAAIVAIPDVHVQSALLTLLDDAGVDLQKFRDGVEGWFNCAMDRVSGWYKRCAHVIIFALGFVIAVALNVNSITIAQNLWTNQATRDALVGAAQGYLEKHKPTANTPPNPGANPTPGSNSPATPNAPSTSPANTPTGSPANVPATNAAPGTPGSSPAADNKPVPPAGSCPASKPATASDQNKSNLDPGLQANIDALQKTNLPIGWKGINLQDLCDDWSFWLVALIGWLLTACAASLGAPFWFDVLGKFIVVRSSIKPGEKSGAANPKS